MDILSSEIMGLFRRKDIVTGNICPKCSMRFWKPERMILHMIKAHKKI